MQAKDIPFKGFNEEDIAIALLKKVGFEHCSLPTITEIHQTTINPLFFCSYKCVDTQVNQGDSSKNTSHFGFKNVPFNCNLLKGVSGSETDNPATFDKDQVWKDEVTGFLDSVMWLQWLQP